MDLWNDALKKYQSIVGVPLELPRSRNDDEMIQFGMDQINNFHQFRHNQKKVDTIRALFKANMNYIIQCAQQLVAAVAPAFPPAMAIGAALTYIMRVCICCPCYNGHSDPETGLSASLR
jgi:hypothetical protein